MSPISPPATMRSPSCDRACPAQTMLSNGAPDTVESRNCRASGRTGPTAAGSCGSVAASFGIDDRPRLTTPEAIGGMRAELAQRRGPFIPHEQLALVRPLRNQRHVHGLEGTAARRVEAPGKHPRSGRWRRNPALGTDPRSRCPRAPPCCGGTCPTSCPGGFARPHAHRRTWRPKAAERRTAFRWETTKGSPIPRLQCEAMERASARTRGAMASHPRPGHPGIRGPGSTPLPCVSTGADTRRKPCKPPRPRTETMFLV